MVTSSRALPPARPIAIDSGALAHLRYIRDTIEAAGTFTSVPGVGCLVMAAVAFTAAAAEWRFGLPRLAVWLTAAPIAAGAALYFLRVKAERQGADLSRAAARRFFLALLPALAAGAVLTWALVRVGAAALLPGTWLLLYGAALSACGVFSHRCVIAAGVAFMICGALALVWPAAGTALLAAGFGGVHAALGVIVWRWHGG